MGVSHFPYKRHTSVARRVVQVLEGKIKTITTNLREAESPRTGEMECISITDCGNGCSLLMSEEPAMDGFRTGPLTKVDPIGSIRSERVGGANLRTLLYWKCFRCIRNLLQLQ